MKYDRNRFYWYKLEKDFFERSDTKYIYNSDDGIKKVYVYLNLITLSIPYGGYLKINENKDYSINSLAAKIGMNSETVHKTIELLEELGLIQLTTENTYLLTEVYDYIESKLKSSIETQNRRDFNSLRKKIAKFANQPINHQDIRMNGDTIHITYINDDRSKLGKFEVARYVWLSKDEIEKFEKDYGGERFHNISLDISKAIIAENIFIYDFEPLFTQLLN